MLKGFSMKVKGARISGLGLKGLRVQGPKLRPEGTRQTSGVCVRECTPAEVVLVYLFGS